MKRKSEKRTKDYRDYLTHDPHACPRQRSANPPGFIGKKHRARLEKRKGIAT